LNLALSAVDHFYRHLRMDRANVRREELPRVAPRALDRDEQRLLLRAAERADARDRALVVLMVFTAVRIGEAVALNIEDLRISPRKGIVIVRAGKGDAYREVPLNALVRVVVEEWTAQRESSPGPVSTGCLSAVPVRGCRPVRRTRRYVASRATRGLCCRRMCCATRA
jgi:integrase